MENKDRVNSFKEILVSQIYSMLSERSIYLENLCDTNMKYPSLENEQYYQNFQLLSFTDYHKHLKVHSRWLPIQLLTDRAKYLLPFVPSNFEVKIEKQN